MPRATFIEGGKEAGGGAEDANSKRNRVRDVSRDNSARAMKRTTSGAIIKAPPIIRMSVI